MRLNELRDNPGASKVRTRVGRGIGSGSGKQGGRGGKGQTARTGVAIGGFEGGQMPLHRRLPKRGFKKWDRKQWNEIKDKHGSRKERVRIGRGIGSGVGKTGGRGGKGQTARTGVAIGGFEGGQMPLHRRLPKRGFNKWRRKDFNEINIGALQRAIDEKVLDAGKPVDLEALVAAGVLRRRKDGLRLLGNGEIKVKIAVTADHASAGAKAAIEKAGGSIKLIVKKVLEADEVKRKKTAAKKAKSAKKPAGEAAEKAEE